ncbi:MAG: YsnF/AvaK domain-containing protein [Janthinobacterium lividum]
MKTIVGLYKTVAEATKVKTALASEGYESEHITVIDQTAGSESSYGSGSSNYGSDSSTGSDTSVGAKIKNFFGGLAGHDDHSHNSYTQGVSNGGALVAVTVPDEEAEDTADLLYQHGASDIEGGYGSTGNTGSSYAGGTGAQDVAVLQGSGNDYSDTASTGRTTGEQVIPVVAEDLLVGKRQVERGGVRIYSRVVSEPVSENISLHDERVVVDRRTVDRPATEADFTGTGTVEVRASGEEAVVGKRSRVVEEILVGKEASDHTEQINDTVRHTEVEVEQTAGETVGTTGTTGSFGTTGTGTGFKR